MGIEQINRPLTVADTHSIRESGQRLSKEVADAALGSVRRGELSASEAWVVLVGTVRSIGNRAGLTPASQLDAIRELYATAAKSGVVTL